MQGFHQVSERERNFENTNYPNQSRCMAPPDWLRTTMARIVPSLQLAKTEDHSYNSIVTPYTLHLTGRSRIFLHKAFFARHYSLPPHQPSVFARLARWQKICHMHFKESHCTIRNHHFKESHFTNSVLSIVLVVYLRELCFLVQKAHCITKQIQNKDQAVCHI